MEDFTMLGETEPEEERERSASGRRAALRRSVTFVAICVLATCALMLGASSAAAGTPPRLPSSYTELPLESGSAQQETTDDAESASPIGPLRARPAPGAGIDQPIGLDPVLAPSAAIVGPVPGPFRSFDGISNSQQSPLFGTLKLPPDTTGDIGPNHYVQAVNTSYAVYSRDGTLLAGPIALAGAGGLFDPADAVSGIDLCDDHNRGDPVVLYDELADRWVIGQFAFALDGGNNPMAPYHQCVAVSQSGDPLGDWWLYEFALSPTATEFPDYPKLGVWGDAYYLSANGFNITLPTAASVGGFAAALERSEMLNGDPADIVLIGPSTSPGDQLFGLLPADVDGGAPPVGAPGLFLVLEDTNFGAPADALRLWSATVDWSGTPSLTLTQAGFIPVADFDSALCTGSRNCIPQPETAVGLDPLSGQLLHRLAYRNFGTHQSLVTAHVADASGTDHAGMRWYELRNSGSSWGLVQSSTFAPDSDHRWMGSIAMDASGNIGLGYTTASATTFPSLNYAGRYASDAAGVLTQGEGTLVAGGGSQMSTTNRWGDYSTLSVDPADGCTFWFTSAYYPVTANALWHTRIGSFSLLSDPSLTAAAHSAGAWSAEPTVDLALTGANASCGVAGYSSAWSTDPAVPADAIADVDSTATALASPELAEGVGHYVRVRTIDARGNAGDGTVLGPFLIDLTSPAKVRIATDGLEPFQPARRFPIAWSAEDPLSGVAQYDVRFRRAPSTSGFGARKAFKKDTAKSKGSFAGKPGSTYCFSVRADDAAGNGSGYSGERCTAVPLDDRALKGKAGWKAAKQPGTYRRTVLKSSRAGASLFKRGIRARSVALIATRCGRCGQVELRHKGRLLGIVDLSKKPFGKKTVNPVPSSKRMRRGKVTVTVVGSGRRVIVDGLAVSRARWDR